ncbi:Zn-dependent hydrolase of the beta-lactamase fold [Methylacidiphilum fumariolicum SolV]|uniref:Zn-dependent hydrolase of the beta-lactamase fold n=3 Tax=Candidatus Methylacidiphilum fumarolicum TaxID=591154 RepID=I0JXP6_METFB|nr:MBL fold metallo-hydrolase [Candidatus Methylacidiphilum fumarolicum]CAI9086340.1 Zn-dependent hydrolase of the beta-lactamase fold [Candidatus Methylacidiphilum fumarolicum]CCG92015.1 Zn-dependent hydrolase of the beta-lactamase fold [Methylacidiphilum fumariolicum SolV]
MGKNMEPIPSKTKRRFFLNVLMSSFFKKREGIEHRPQFPKVNSGQICLTWVGHASFLLQTHKHNILIDPNWSNWMLIIRRLKRAGIALDALPSIDLVLITHAHFDHLNKKTLKMIAKNQPIIVPKGVKNLVRGIGFEKILEMNWWERIEIDGTEITFTPAKHWGARVLADFHRGYGGYCLKFDGRSVYHCGDTAYFEKFSEIGERLHPEVVLMPIGSYDPPSGRDVHINPEKAVQAFQELRGKIMIPMHFGTYRMSYEPLHEPAYRLIMAAKKKGILSQVCFLNEGIPTIL